MRERGSCCDDPLADQGVALDELPFVGVERARLAEDRLGNGGFADVVQLGGDPRQRRLRARALASPPSRPRARQRGQVSDEILALLGDHLQRGRLVLPIALSLPGACRSRGAGRRGGGRARGLPPRGHARGADRAADRELLPLVGECRAARHELLRGRRRRVRDDEFVAADPVCRAFAVDDAARRRPRRASRASPAGWPNVSL